MGRQLTPEEAGRALGRRLGPLPDAVVHAVLDIVDADTPRPDETSAA